VPGRTVGRSLRDFRRQMRGGRAQLVPWLEDFSFTGPTTPDHVQGQTRAALARARWLLGWDQHTMMPPDGPPARGDQLATLDGFAHELFISDEVGELLDGRGANAQELDPESIHAPLIRVTRQDWEKARKVPAELRAEITKAEVLATPAWADARKNANDDALLPVRRRNVA